MITSGIMLFSTVDTFVVVDEVVVIDVFFVVICGLGVVLTDVLSIVGFEDAIVTLEVVGRLVYLVVVGLFVVTAGFFVVLRVGFVGYFVDNTGLLVGLVVDVGLGRRGFCVGLVVGLLVVLGFTVVLAGLLVGLLAAGLCVGLGVKGLGAIVVGFVMAGAVLLTIGTGLGTVGFVTKGISIELGLIVGGAELKVGFFCVILVVGFAVDLLSIFVVDLVEDMGLNVVRSFTIPSTL